MMRVRAAWVLCGVSALCAGCAAPVDSADGAGEDVGEAASAFCIEGGIADVVGQMPDPTYYKYSSFWATSPTNTYGSAACSGRWVVDVTKLVTFNQPPYARAFGDTTGLTNNVMCEAATVDMVVYYYSGAAPGLWVPLGYYTANGHWSDTGGCLLTVSAPVVGPSLQGIRVAASAHRIVLNAPYPVKVRAGVDASHSGPQ